MSSLDHDHLLHEGPAPRQRAGSPLAPAGGTRSRRRPAASAGDEALTAPAPRQGQEQSAASRPARRPKADPPQAPAKKTGAHRAGAHRAAGARAAAAKSSPKSTATAKPAAAKPAAAKPAAAKTAAAKPAAAKPTAAKPAAAKPAAAKPTAAAKKTASKTTAAAKKTAATAPRAAVEAPAAVSVAAAAATDTPTGASTRRPRPAPVAPAQPLPEAVVDAQPVEDIEDAVALAAAGEARSRTVVEEVAAAPVVAVLEIGDGEPDDRRARPGRRLSRVLRRRPALYLAAALVAALGVGAVYTVPSAQADPAERPSHSMNVAAELGLSQEDMQAPDAHDADRLAELAATRASREAEQSAAVQVQQQADAAAVEAARPRAVLPVQGARLTSVFGSRWGTLHAGIDLAAPIGTPEYASMDGVVLEAGPASGFGLAVYIQHQNGDVTVYGHMEQILVEPGQVVKAGDEIALLGNRGQSTGPHLHFEVHVGGINGEKVDPVPWLQERGVAVG